MHDSFLHHRRWFYLKVASVLSLAALVVYAVDDPPYGPNGGTWLGYGLGTLGAVLIVWLAWLGVRKRRYRSNLGTMKGWTSAHVYLGLSLLVIVTLHTGFEFGANVHTMAYILMLLVIVSGVYGIVAYARYPRLITENRSQSTRDSWMGEILELNEKAVQLADSISPEAHRIVVRSVARIQLGGGLRDQLFRPKVPGAGGEVKAMDALLRLKQPAPGPGSTGAYGRTTMFMADQIVAADDTSHVEKSKNLLDLLTRRNELVELVTRDIQAHARMQIWLYLHVPLTVALLAALIAHVVSVFLYR